MDQFSLSLLEDQRNLTVSLYFTGQGTEKSDGVVHGMADKNSGQLMRLETPVRIASNTKTFTAAAILRLWEQNLLDLDAPIAALVTPSYCEWFSNAGYDFQSITIRHLLSHSSGLYDHADESYIIDVKANPHHFWTRDEQIWRYINQGHPFVAPGEKFIYSDTGYLLLADIIERITQKSLAQAVRQLLKFDELGLTTAYWELLEAPPANDLPRARQYLGDFDGTDVSATMDLYGGGGLVMSIPDLAAFMAHLFEGRIYDKPQTLAEMIAKGEHEGAQDYRLGLMVQVINSQTLYYHLGFWGTTAYYHPKRHVSAAGFVNNRDKRMWMTSLLEQRLTDGED